MLVTLGSGSSDPKRASFCDDKIRRIIVAEVAATIREAIPDMFWSITTMLIAGVISCGTWSSKT